MYEELARGFGVTDIRPLLKSEKANGARMHTASGFPATLLAQLGNAAGMEEWHADYRSLRTSRARMLADLAATRIDGPTGPVRPSPLLVCAEQPANARSSSGSDDGRDGSASGR